MTIIQCDKCLEKIFGDYDHHKIVIISYGDRTEEFDLCSECASKFRAWIEDREGKI